MNRLACAIIDDDSISIKLIEGMAEKTGLLDIQGVFTSSTEAAQWLSTNRVDLLFLDMELPELSGWELLRTLVHRPEVIVISAHPNFAVDAFEFAVADFLLKPLRDYGRFLMAVNKVVAKVKPMPAVQDDALFVRIDTLLLKLNIHDIYWIEAFGDYIKIQTSEKVHTVYSSLKKIEEKLPPKFVRIHRSYIVNFSKVTNIDPSSVEVNKRILPISQSYKDELLTRVKVL